MGYPQHYFCGTCRESWVVEGGKQLSDGPLAHAKTHDHKVYCMSSLMESPNVFTGFLVQEDKERFDELKKVYLEAVELCRTRLSINNLAELVAARNELVYFRSKNGKSAVKGEGKSA